MKKYTDLGLIIFDIIFTFIFLIKGYWIFGTMSIICAICESVDYYRLYNTITNDNEKNSDIIFKFVNPYI